MPAKGRNMEPRSMTANRTEKTGRHRDVSSPRKNGKVQVSKGKAGTQTWSELWK